MFARKAPSATPGHMLRPQRTSAASAIPVGGQTAVTLVVSLGKERYDVPPTWGRT